MADECMSSAEGDGDDELVVVVEIKLADVRLKYNSAYRLTTQRW